MGVYVRDVLIGCWNEVIVVWNYLLILINIMMVNIGLLRYEYEFICIKV